MVILLRSMPGQDLFVSNGEALRFHLGSDQPTALPLGEPAPDAIPFVMRESEFQAFGFHGTGLTDSSGIR